MGLIHITPGLKAAVSQQAAPTLLLLDKYPGSVAAFSFRKLKNGYTGDAAGVFEDGGSTTADIGFDANGDFDETALLAHVGVNNGTLVDFYDQTGGGRKFNQTAASARPLLVSAGTPQKSNSRQTVIYDGTDDEINTTDTNFWKFLHDGTDWTMYLIFKMVAANPDNLTGFFGNNNSTGANPGIDFQFDDRSSVSKNDQLYARCTTGLGAPHIFIATSANNDAPAQTLLVITYRYDNGAAGDDFGIYVNDVLKGSADTGATHSSSNPSNAMQIGAVGSGIANCNCEIPELIVYSGVAHDATTMTSIVNNMKTYWGI